MPSIFTMRCLLFFLCACPFIAATSDVPKDRYPPATASSQWSGFGGNIYNNRWAWNNEVIDSSNAGSLKPHCSLTYRYGVSAAPTIHGEIAYFPTWSGMFVALNYVTCEVQWQLNVTHLIVQHAPISKAQEIISPVSRSSPQIDGQVLYLTTLIHCLLVAADRDSGTVLSTVQINPHPLALGTLSPTLYNGRLFAGASSAEQNAADYIPGYNCCNFTGNMAAYDFDPTTKRFQLIWDTKMVSPDLDFAGGPVWGSQPSIDVKRSQIFIGTGGVYDIPQEYQACLKQRNEIQVVREGKVSLTCIPKGLVQDAVLALDMHTGHINWMQELTPLDPWTYACGNGYGTVPRNKTLCPYPPGKDADFGMAPAFIPGSEFTPYGYDTVVAGQKNGMLYAFSAQAGELFWSTKTSPGGTAAGLIWGVGVDEANIYFTAVNSDWDKWTLYPSQKTIGNSAFGAALLRDGSLLWQTASPFNSTSSVPPTVVNDVVFFGRGSEGINGDTPGGLIPILKKTGKIIKDYHLRTNFHGGIAIQDRFVLFGTGYRGTPTYSKNGSFEVWKI